MLAHGFTQNRRCWGAFGDALATWAQVVRVDLPGHGGSGRIEASVEAGAELLGDVGERAHYVGYSMGGRHVLRLALDRPDLVLSAVLIGTHPGIEDPSARARRRTWDLDMAKRLEQVGLAPFLDEWLSMPLFQGLDSESAHLEARLGNTTAGLAGSLRLAGTGSQQPLWSRLDALEPPTLFMAGERDAKYRDIGSRASRTAPGVVRSVVVSGAGHAPHLERPESAADIVRRWILI